MIFICDIDGTISELTDKQKSFLRKKHTYSGSFDHKNLAEIEGLTWEKDYYSDIANQKPMQINIEIALHFLKASDVNFKFITARSEKFRQETESWIWDNLKSDKERTPSFYQAGSEDLFMRGVGDHRPAHIVKRDIFRSVTKAIWFPKDRPAIAFEDQTDCQEMYMTEGLKIITPMISPERQET